MKISRSLIDYKIDMYPDSNELKITAYIPSTLIRSIKVLMLNNYAIRERISVNMICMALAKIDTPKSACFTFMKDFFISATQLAQHFRNH